MLKAIGNQFMCVDVLSTKVFVLITGVNEKFLCQR